MTVNEVVEQQRGLLALGAWCAQRYSLVWQVGLIGDAEDDERPVQQFIEFVRTENERIPVHLKFSEMLLHVHHYTGSAAQYLELCKYFKAVFVSFAPVTPGYLQRAEQVDRWFSELGRTVPLQRVLLESQFPTFRSQDKMVGGYIFTVLFIHCIL